MARLNFQIIGIYYADNVQGGKQTKQHLQARDARASAMAQRRKAMAAAPKKRPAATGGGRSRAGSGISMKV